MSEKSRGFLRDNALSLTFGAVFLNLVLLAYRAYRRPAAAHLWSSDAYSAE